MDYEKKYKAVLEQARDYYNRVQTDYARKELENIFPELRESEDERIRKEIINYLDFAESHNLLRAADYKKKKGWLAYLEKQKDAFENGRQLGIMQEQARQELEWTDEKQKEHQNNSDAPKKALGGALISPLDKDMNLDEIAQDYVDNVKEYNPEPTWDLIQTAVCYGYHYYDQKEQKPNYCHHEVDETGWTEVNTARHFYAKGYEQAERDLALTWEDIKTIEQIITTSDWYDFEINGKLWSQEFYEEVLKRFKEARK